ncbi:cytochrome P450 [Saccharopolyspora sp. CA-218241]|uniref:cytochrome P450 n=1 Tax=Saccharopolyspora sp. CA-218241 TaxID=3240027 RepID=UPI003D975BB3
MAEVPEVLDGARIHQQADALRAAGPAVRVRLPEGGEVWSVTRGEVITRLLADPVIVKDARWSLPGARPGEWPWLFPAVRVAEPEPVDGVRHERLAALVREAFTADRIAALRPEVAALVDCLLENMANGRTGGAVDFRASFAALLPSRVICALLGVPDALRAELRGALDDVLDAGAGRVPKREELLDALRALVRSKRERPGDDLTSALLHVDRLTDTELLGVLALLVGAGSGTVVSLLDHAVYELLRDPAQLEEVRTSDRWPDVVDEVLRLHPPIVHLPLRYATADVDLGDGVVIAAGEPVLIGYGVPGRDPAVHPEPARFAVDRVDKAHLAFGHGVHRCLGAPLARMQAEVALPRLFDRFPDLALAEPTGVPPRRPSYIGNDFSSVLVHLGGSHSH